MFANYIRAARARANMTQSELGTRLHVSEKAVSAWETSRCVPDPALWTALADQLGLPLLDLIDAIFGRSERIGALLLPCCNRRYRCPPSR